MSVYPLILMIIIVMQVEYSRERSVYDPKRVENESESTEASKDEQLYPKSGCTYRKIPGLTIPVEMDWRSRGVLTPVKDQGSECRSCWAFATTAVVEAHLAIQTGDLVPLSSQNVLDCTNGTKGCDGGWMNYAYEYMKQNGVNTLNSYPTLYEGSKSKCRFNRYGDIIKIDRYIDIKPGDEEAMAEVVGTKGPITVSLDYSDIRSYKSGVYENKDCRKDYPQHAMAIVGYGRDESETPYWILRDSYGAEIENGGYVKIRRGTNECGIANFPSFPDFDTDDCE